MSYAAAQLAIEVQLATPLAGWLVQWPNGPKIQPSGSAYAEVFHMPASTFVDTLGQYGQDLVPAVTQVNLYYPLESGDNSAAVAVDTFRDSFAAGQWIGNSSQAVLIRTCGPGPAKRDGSYFKAIVSIQWEARIARSPGDAEFLPPPLTRFQSAVTDAGLLTLTNSYYNYTVGGAEDFIGISTTGRAGGDVVRLTFLSARSVRHNQSVPTGFARLRLTTLGSGGYLDPIGIDADSCMTFQFHDETTPNVWKLIGGPL